MNILDMFIDSNDLYELVEKANKGDMEIGQILLEAQMVINGFITNFNFLRSNIVVDTHMMYGEAFSDDNVKYFSVCLILFNSDTKEQTFVVVPFRLVLVEQPFMPVGLTVIRQQQYA